MWSFEITVGDLGRRMNSASKARVTWRTHSYQRALTPERLAKLELDQITLAERNLQPGAYAMPAFAVTLAIMLTAWVPLEFLAGWVAAVCATSIRYWYGYQFLRKPATTVADLRGWHLLLAALQLVGVAVWMFPAVAFYEYCSETGQMLLSLVMGCTMAASAALCAPSRYYLYTALAPYGTALVLPPLFHGGSLHIGLAILGAGLSMFLIHLARTLHLSARDLFLTREDKNELIEQLAAAKIESDKARHRAEAASQAKSEFLANMSHELRTPLNAILGFSEIMKGEVFGPLGSPQYAEYADHIHGSGQHLLGLINDVLDLAKIEAGRYVVRAIEIDMREATKNAMTLFDVRVAESNVTLKAEVEAGLPLLLADERALRQILLNLISNAIKFTPSGGTVTVFARRGVVGGMDVGVRDTGVGIDPADIDTVFEAFGQGQHDIAVCEKGTGLGLPIVRGLVQAHGGKVALSSELGRGTSVICSFPRERLTAPQPMPIRLATVI